MLTPKLTPTSHFDTNSLYQNIRYIVYCSNKTTRCCGKSALITRRSEVRIFLPQPQKERHTIRCVFSFCRCELVMMDLENAPAFSRFCACTTYRSARSRRKTKVRIFLPQPKNLIHLLVSEVFLVSKKLKLPYLKPLKNYDMLLLKGR